MGISKDVSIFLSYNRFDESIANKIDNFFRESNVEIKRDIRNIPRWGSIKDFMGTIRTQDSAILIVSKNYLKSVNCMFEVLEIMKEQLYREKIFPLVTEKKIYNALGRSTYIKHWENKCNKLEEEIKKLDLGNAAELTQDLKQHRRIAASIGEFMSIVSDMNNPEENDVIKSIIETLKARGVKVSGIKQQYQDQEKKLSTEEKNELLSRIESLKSQLDLEKAHKDLLTKKLNMERKHIPPELKQEIDSEKKNYPEFYEVNLNFAFVCAGNNVTAGYVLHSLRKEAIKGSSPLTLLCSINGMKNELGILVAAVIMKLREKVSIT